MEVYRTQLWSSWTSTETKPTMTDIPVAKAQLLGRANDFDGGATAAWMSGLRDPTWRAVRDAHTGHAIHVVSDRAFDALTPDLLLGLRLLNWMGRSPVVWYWWDHAWPRLLPGDTLPSKVHLNGGWAIPGVPEVHVYRREEAHKVLLHETIHALRLDVLHASVEPVRSEFEMVFGRRLYPHLGEAFTELYAEWLWSIAGARSLAAAKKRWISQLACSSAQAAAIWARIRHTKEDEDTNVFAYYILKWVLMSAHLDVVLLAPTATVPLWFSWWSAMRPELDSMASAASTSVSQEMKMGMTCV